MNTLRFGSKARNSKIEVIEMRNDKLSVQSMEFAVSVIALVKDLKQRKESIMSNQIG